MTVVAVTLFVFAAAVSGWLLLRDLKRAVVRRRLRRQLKPLTEGFVRLQIVVRDSLTPALQRASASLVEFGKALNKEQHGHHQ